MISCFPKRGVIATVTLVFVGIVGTSCGGDDDDASATCGNGKKEGSEQCDKTAPSCAEATKGARPNGTATCTAKCTINTDSCSLGGGGSGGASG
jgi:hypothetical protein